MILSKKKMAKIPACHKQDGVLQDSRLGNHEADFRKVQILPTWKSICAVGTPSADRL